MLDDHGCFGQALLKRVESLPALTGRPASGAWLNFLGTATGSRDDSRETGVCRSVASDGQGGRGDLHQLLYKLLHWLLDHLLEPISRPPTVSLTVNGLGAGCTHAVSTMLSTTTHGISFLNMVTSFLKGPEKQRYLYAK